MWNFINCVQATKSYKLYVGFTFQIIYTPFCIIVPCQQFSVGGDDMQMDIVISRL